MAFFCLLAAGLFAPQALRAMEPGVVIFCENLDDSYVPQNPGNVFTGPAVSWIAHSEKPFGKPELTVSVYQDQNGIQTLLDRRQTHVNPAWDTLAIRNMPLPDVGDYVISLTTGDGDQIATGKVRISQMEKNAEPKPEEEMGTTLKALFHKYAPKGK